MLHVYNLLLERNPNLRWSRQLTEQTRLGGSSSFVLGNGTNTVSCMQSHRAAWISACKIASANPCNQERSKSGLSRPWMEVWIQPNSSVPYPLPSLPPGLPSLCPITPALLALPSICPPFAPLQHHALGVGLGWQN